MVVTFILHCSAIIQPGLQQVVVNETVFSSLFHCPNSPPLPRLPFPPLFNYSAIQLFIQQEALLGASHCADTGVAETDETHPCAQGVPVSSPFEVTVVLTLALPPQRGKAQSLPCLQEYLGVSEMELPLCKLN